MNWDVIEGKWAQLKGHVRSKWAKLTDDDMTMLGGKKDTLVGKLQERYGLMKDDAEREIDEWVASLDQGEDDTDPQMSPPKKSAARTGAPSR